MFDEMKCAALSAKLEADNPVAGQARMVLDCATRAGAEAFGIDAGVIAPGKLADAILVDLNHPAMTPNYHLVSNLVYSADTSVVRTVICDGRVLMRDRVVPGEAEIVAAMDETARKYAPYALRQGVRAGPGPETGT